MFDLQKATHLIPGHKDDMGLGLEWRSAELECDGTAAVHQEVEPAVVAGDGEALLGRGRAHAYSH